jgi:hypothetical protein
MKEWHRTVLLVLLLLFALAAIWWLHTGHESLLLDSLAR